MHYQKKTWLISDPHWGHKGICNFTFEGTEKKIRPWDCPEKMNEEMSDLWNQTVDPRDKVYCLGDWAINRRFANYGKHLHGEKVLILGNHDTRYTKELLEVFKELRAYHLLHSCILSHIPIHESQLERFGVNIHGHTHQNRVKKDGKIDFRYHCVCVEQTDFKPILLEEVFARIEAEGGVIGLGKKETLDKKFGTS